METVDKPTHRGGEGRGLWRRRGEGGGQVGEDNTGGGRGRSDGARVWIHSATSVTEEVCVAPPSDVYRKVGTQPAVRIQTVRLRLVRGLSKTQSQITPTSYPCLSQRQCNAKRRDGDKRE